MADIVRTAPIEREPLEASAADPDLDMGFNARRLRANLLRSETAIRAFARLGVERSLIERAGLGIKERNVTATGLEISGVITYPLDLSGGRCRYGYINLAGVTVNPDHPVAWSPGEARTLTFGAGGVLLVLASPTAVLQARAVIEARRVAVAAAASSQPDRIPAEWHSASYWTLWERVILDDALPATVKAAIAAAAGRSVEIATGAALSEDPVVGPATALGDWLDCMLQKARPFVIDTPVEDIVGGKAGDYAAMPISLHGGVAAGRMYYPFVIERRQACSGGGLLCSYETMVLRSDGVVLEARTLPAPAGTPAWQRVHCLTDGTRISAPPVQSRNSTWSFGAIQRFIADHDAGRDPASCPAAEVMVKVHRFLARRVSLPQPTDLWVAAAFVLMTHMFRIFPAIPLLLIEGPQGSGKSELASAIASLGFNAVTMGQGSAAALVRVTQECGGLVVLDDVEGLSAGGVGFSELSQCLKVGYRASTARKPVALGSGRVETFDFFGPRVLTCTRGVEPILGSRCISIRTAAADGTHSVPDADPATLRDELHVLGMTSATQLAEAYACFAVDVRHDEIWAPILAIVETLGPVEAIEAVRAAKARHNR